MMVFGVGRCGVPVVRLYSSIGLPLLTWPKIQFVPWLSCLLLLSPAAVSQALPQIDPAGVVNAASFAQPISPGSLVSIFGSNLAATTMTAQGVPLPTELAGTSVTLNGTRAQLLFVSQRQINLEAPSSLEWSLFDGLVEAP
jgi:hypothetical protein